MLTGIQLYSHTTKCELADFGGEFGRFLHSAKRLEILPTYNVHQEQEALKAFRDGKEVSPSFNTDWHEILKQAADRQARVSRLRVIPTVPNEYLRFEILHGYVQSAELGEGQQFVAEDDFTSALGAEGAAPDFWVFDDERVFLMIYDPRGSFMGVLKADTTAATELLGLYERLSASSRNLTWAVEEYLRKAQD